jgi:(2R)-sulfolactate sulfo-lyase subunit alpha
MAEVSMTGLALALSCNRYPRIFSNFRYGVYSGGSMIHILVHDKKDTVGVAVIEGIKAGQEMIGWVMEDDSTIKVKAINDIPIGHKAALREIKKGDTIIKYGFDIGKAVADIKLGEHAHVHNIKTKRW